MGQMMLPPSRWVPTGPNTSQPTGAATGGCSADAKAVPWTSWTICAHTHVYIYINTIIVIITVIIIIIIILI